MKDDDQFLDEDLGEFTANQLPPGAVVVDARDPATMLKSLTAALGEDNGCQLFSTMTGIHLMDNKLIPSRATEYDTIH